MTSGLIVGAVALVDLQVLDVISTNRSESSGNGYEANPLMAWVQAKIGGAWWLGKLAILPLLVMCWLTTIYAPAYVIVAVIIVWALVAYYAYTVAKNFSIAAGK